jgi:hypothetical protein
MNQSRQNTDRVIMIHPTLMRSRWPLSEYHWMTFAGVASPSGAPPKSMIVPTTKKTTYNRPPRMVQRATLRGRAATAASMEPPLDAGADARPLRPRFSPCVVSPAPLTL